MTVEAVSRPRSQWQVADLSLPFALVATFSKEEEIVDRSPDAGAGSDLEHTRHRLSGGHAIVRVPRQRRHVMGDHDPPLERRPCEHCGIGRPGKSGVLDANEVEVALPA